MKAPVRLAFCFVHDRRTGRTISVNVSSDGKQADAECGVPVMSANGRYVAFFSFATNPSGERNDGVGELDVFVHDFRG